MTPQLSHYDVRSVTSLADALTLLEREPNAWRFLAGGTDLMVLLHSGKLTHTKFINLWNLSELKGIEVTPDQITLGALTTFAEIQRHPALAQEFPLLLQAASQIGSIAIQNRATIGGNIANASPAADSSPVLLAYGADVVLFSAQGRRALPYERFHKGYRETALQPNELIGSIRLPRTSDGASRRHYFRKVGPRKAMAISKVALAGVAQLENGTIKTIRIALGSVAPTPIRCTLTEQILIDQRVKPTVVAAAKHELAKETAPIDDLRSTARYRNRIAQNLLEEFLSTLCGTGSQS